MKKSRTYIKRNIEKGAYSNKETGEEVKVLDSNIEDLSGVRMGIRVVYFTNGEKNYVKDEFEFLNEFELKRK